MRWRRAPMLLLLAAASQPLAHADAEDFDIEVEGLSSALRKNVEARLSILKAVEAQTDENPVSNRRLRALNRVAEKDIASALQPYGYYGPVITTDFDPDARRATYTVEAGPRTVVRRFTLDWEGEGTDFTPLRSIPERFTLKVGDPLRHKRYEADKSLLTQAAFEMGFLDARFTSSVMRVWADEQQADIEWRFDTGQRWAFGFITIEESAVDADVIARYLRIYPGDPFSPQAVLDTQFALNDLGYFDKVEIIPEREAQSDGQIPLRIHTTPRKGALYSTGIGYGTDTGARLSLGAEWRRLNRRGHKLRTDIRLSEVQNRLIAEYRIPLGNKQGEQLSFTAGSLDEKFDTGDTLKYEFGVSLDRTPGSWQRRMYLNFEHEESDLGDTQQSSDLLIPGISLNRSSLDDPIHPRRGWSVFVDVHGANANALSTTTFLQTSMLLRGALPLWDGARLLLRTELGASFNDEFNELPASQRFFAGGDQSVRGYGYRTIGPTDDSGEVVGGEYLTTASAELDQTLIGNWGAALFYDLGGVDNDPGPKLLQGGGAGLRYRAPIGFVQIDVGYPIDRPDDGPRLHIGVRVGL